VIFRETPVPGLTRDLLLRPVPLSLAARGPGASPGRGSPLLNHSAPEMVHGSFRLHHGLSSLWSDLHRPNRQPFGTGRGASCRALASYGEIQYPNLGLVRSPRGVRRQPSAGTRDQTVASRREERSDRRAQSGLARCDGASSVIAVHASTSLRSRVKPGTGFPFSSRSRK